MLTTTRRTFLFFSFQLALFYLFKLNITKVKIRVNGIIAIVIVYIDLV